MLLHWTLVVRPQTHIADQLMAKSSKNFRMDASLGSAAAAGLAKRRCPKISDFMNG